MSIKYKLWILTLAMLLLTTQVMAVTRTAFTDGASTYNMTFTYNGTNNNTAYIPVPSGSIISYLVMNITGYQPTLLNQTILGQNNTNVSNPYRGYWVENLPTINPEYANDGNYNTASASTAGTYHSFNVNFSINTTSSYNLTYKTGFGSASIDALCWNTSSSSWITINSASNLITYNLQVPNDCVQGSTNMKLNFSIIISSGTVNFYDLNITEYRNNTQYPSNVSIYVNGAFGFNYGSSNASQLNLTTRANLSSAISGLNNYTSLNVTFLSNTSGGLYVNDFYLIYSDNTTIYVKEEYQDRIYNASNVSITRSITGVETQNTWTTTGSVSLANLNYTAIVDISYQDAVKNFPLRHYYYINNGLLSTNNVNLTVINETNTTLTLFTLYKEDGNPLPNYYLGVERKQISQDRFVTVEMHHLDFNGQAIMNVVPYDEIYRFRIYNTDLTQVYLSNETNIKSSSVILTIRTTENIWQSYEVIRDIPTIAPTYNNATKQFYAAWNHSIVNYTDFSVILRSGFGDITICNNRTYSTSGIVYCTIDENASGYYIAQLFAETRTNFSRGFLGGAEYRYDNISNTMNRGGLFASAILILGLTLFGVYNPAVALIFGLVGVIITAIMGFWIAAVGLISVIVIIGGIILFKLRT